MISFSPLSQHCTTAEGSLEVEDLETVDPGRTKYARIAKEPKEADESPGYPIPAGGPTSPQHDGVHVGVEVQEVSGRSGECRCAGAKSLALQRSYVIISCTIS